MAIPSDEMPLCPKSEKLHGQGPRALVGQRRCEDRGDAYSVGMVQAASPRTDESDMELRRQARAIFRALAKRYPDAHCELDFATPLELLVATVLSAQCTDQRVNKVTPELFRRYPDAAALAGAKREGLEQVIAPTGFFRQKAQTIQQIGQRLCDDFGGDVPADLDSLVSLPGVGRKTANVVLSNAFDIPGITVDTHFGRLARRFGWTSQMNPDKVEQDVAALFPAKDYTMLSHYVVWHGRRICHARKPACGACPVASLCPSFGEGPTDTEEAEALVRTQGRA